MWHPHAKRIIIPQAPQDLRSTGGGKKLVWHTTEGSSAEGAIGAYHANGNCPHFTIEVRGNRRYLYQHLSTDVMASALRHPSGTPATNTANCIQVEIVGFSSQSAVWSGATYHYLHLLAKWINRHCGVPMTEGHEKGISWRHPKRLSPQEFFLYAGHCGHMHVPNNDHGDPGFGFHIGHVLYDVR